MWNYVYICSNSSHISAQYFCLLIGGGLRVIKMMGGGLQHMGDIKRKWGDLKSRRHHDIYIYNIYVYGFYFVWYKPIHFYPLLNPAIQRMCNTLNILCPRCREQDESHPHFIFYCKLSYVTPDYISELNNLKYSFNIPFKFSLKTIIMSFFWILWWCTFKNSTKILELILMHQWTFLRTWNSILNNNGNLNIQFN